MGLLDNLKNKVQQQQRPPSYGGQGGGYGGGPGGYGGGQGGYGGQPQSPYGQGAPAFPSSPQPPSNNQQSSGQDSKGDDRPLPEGWVKQWDSNYNRHFYVDTKANPPRSIWVHPSDENGPSKQPQQQFTAPSGPPPNDNRQGWGQGPPHGYGQQGPYGGGYPQQQPPYGGYQQQQPPYGGGYGQQPMMMQQPMAGGNRMGGGRFGGGGGGMGMGGMALGAGAGLLGGAMLMHGIDDMQDDAYRDGYQDGQDNDYGDGGDDFGGGDMGGGDF